MKTRRTTRVCLLALIILLMARAMRLIREPRQGTLTVPVTLTQVNVFRSTGCYINQTGTTCQNYKN